VDGHEGLERIRRAAAALGRQARPRRPWPSLWFLTDPRRTPDPLAVVERLPRGSGVIFRGFGAADASEVARALRRATRRRGLVLLIAQDWRLAAATGADGVHLPQRWMGLAPRLRRARRGWLITGAAHNASAVVAGGRLKLDALLVSPVFASRSPSAGAPLGPVRFAALARLAKVPVIALGGINSITAPRLAASGAAGLAAIDGLMEVRT
jgi:thiamine-phosphate pyrophosphorylase